MKDRLPIRTGKTAVILSIAAMCAATLQAGVFDDAAVWIREFRDVNRNGNIDDAGEVPDARNVLSPMSGLICYGSASGRECRTENVACAYSGRTMQIPCCHLPQVVSPTLVDGKEIYLGNFCSFGVLGANGGGVSVTNATHTFFMRIRPDWLLHSDAQGKTMWVMGGIGFQLGMNLEEGGLLAVKASYAKDGNDKYSAINGNVYLHTNAWCDIATVFDGSKVSFYAVTNGGPLQVSSVSVSPPKNAIYEDLYFGLYQGGNDNSTAKTPYIWSFRGAIAQMAFWNRALSEREIRSAMAFPATDVFNLGIDNGSSGEFGADASLSGVSLAAGVDVWSVAPFNLPPRVQVSYAFAADAIAASLPQVLHLTALPDSGAGSVAVAVNGVRLANLNAAPGQTTGVYVPTNTLIAGENLLTLEGCGTGTVLVDALSLGGSIQVGENNNATSEFGRRDASHSIDNIDGLWNEWSFVDYDIGPEQTNEIRISVSEYAARRHKWLFELDAHSPVTPQSESDYGVTLLVNGEEVHRLWFPEGARDSVFAAKLPAGFLRPGVNSLSLVAHVSATPTKRWLCVDCWRLSVQEAPVPFCIMVR